MRGGFLGGPGCHGLSVGSLGQNQGKFANVSDIIFDDFSIHGAVYGARFKSWIGGQGLVSCVVIGNKGARADLPRPATSPGATSGCRTLPTLSS